MELFNRGTSRSTCGAGSSRAAISFTFAEDTLLEPGAYLVVAADLAAFGARYPVVANVVGGWTGQLANGGEQIELRNAAGEVQSEVTYSDGGDWAVRLRGSGEDRLWSLTSTGATAYATVLGHYGNNDQVVISGADQPEYNGVFGVFNVAEQRLSLLGLRRSAQPGHRRRCLPAVDRLRAGGLGVVVAG